MSLIIRAIVITVAPVRVGDKIEGFWVDANALDHLGDCGHVVPSKAERVTA